VRTEHAEAQTLEKRAKTVGVDDANFFVALQGTLFQVESLKKIRKEFLKFPSYRKLNARVEKRIFNGIEENPVEESNVPSLMVCDALSI
jgi:hypothetical protein